jgi:1-acyl-sn-glycerol-3-phosphate acyltransferase
MYIITLPMEIICSIILYIIGWKNINPKLVNILNKHNKIICVFSHTSYYDFFIMLLYKYKYYLVFQYMKVLIKPDYFNGILGYLLTCIGGIPSTNVNIKNGGNLNKIVDTLNQTERCVFLISPKGSILKREWRSGYYHIGQALKAPYVAVGLDYEYKNIYVGDIINNDNTEKSVKEKLYNDLSKIAPLYPEQENMEIRKYDKNNISVINYSNIKNTIAIISSSFFIYYFIIA